MTISPDIHWADVLDWRMTRQFLTGPRADGVEQVVKRLTTVPAWSGDAELAVGLRCSTAVPGAVTAAFERGQLVKTFAFRGATHYFLPEDVGNYLALRSIGRQWELKSWCDFYGLAPSDWPALRQLVRESLADGPMTQVQLATAVTASPRFHQLGDAITSGSLTFVKPFAWQGDLSLAPSGGADVVVQSLDESPGWGGMPTADEAGPRAILDYLGAYGPATLANLQYWFGEGLSAGRKNITRWIGALVGSGMAELEIDGTAAFCLADQLDDLVRHRASGAVRLLPGLDQWMLGPGTADPNVVPARHRAAVSRGANVVLVGGRAAGTWTISKDVLIAAGFDGEVLSSTDVESEAQRISDILARPLTVQTQ
jgi:hypothetical protein